MALVDVARLQHALDDRSRAGIGVIDHGAAVHVRRRAVRQHAGAVEGERIAVLAVGRLRRLLELLGERRLEEVDLWKVQHVEPQHRLVGGVAVVVRRPVRGDDEVARRHVGFLALDRGIGALAVEHEADRRGHMSMRRGNLARQDHLHAGEERVGGARFASHARILQDQHPPLGLFGRDQPARFHHQALDVVVVPDDRRAARHRLLGHDAAHHLPERRHAVLGDALIVFLPHRLDVVLGARGLVFGRLGRGRARHGALPWVGLGCPD